MSPNPIKMARLYPDRRARTAMEARVEATVDRMWPESRVQRRCHQRLQSPGVAAEDGHPYLPGSVAREYHSTVPHHYIVT